MSKDYIKIVCIDKLASWYDVSLYGKCYYTPIVNNYYTDCNAMELFKNKEKGVCIDIFELDDNILVNITFYFSHRFILYTEWLAIHREQQINEILND